MQNKINQKHSEFKSTTEGSRVEDSKQKGQSTIMDNYLNPCGSKLGSFNSGRNLKSAVNGKNSLITNFYSSYLRYQILNQNFKQN